MNVLTVLYFLRRRAVKRPGGCARMVWGRGRQRIYCRTTKADGRTFCGSIQNSNEHGGERQRRMRCAEMHRQRGHLCQIRPGCPFFCTRTRNPVQQRMGMQVGARVWSQCAKILAGDPTKAIAGAICTGGTTHETERSQRWGQRIRHMPGRGMQGDMHP